MKKIEPLKLAGWITMGLGAVLSIAQGVIDDKKNESIMRDEIQKAVTAALEKKES